MRQQREVSLATRLPRGLSAVIRVVALVVILPFCASAHAQQMTVTSTTSKYDPLAVPTGRRFRFKLPTPRSDPHGGNIYFLNVTSLQNGEVYFEVTGDYSAAFEDVTPDTAITISVPPDGTVGTSGPSERKIIEVTSDETDFSVFADLPFEGNSEGMQILPTAAWGKDYVVASYAAQLDGGDSTDTPSEFVVISNGDSTILTINPSDDIRGGSPKTIIHERHVPFSDTLTYGRSIQYQMIRSTGTNSDATGTTIHASRPIGVIAATQFASIPSTYSVPNFLCEMIPPVSLWG